MTILQQAQFNSAAQVIPDADIIIVPPQTQYLNGVPANTAGIVGTASWGPVNVPQLVSDVASYVSIFGPVMNRTYDMGTHVAAAVAQGANNFQCVRVTDSTDAAATASCTVANSTLASAIASAINNGISTLRPASRLVVANAATTSVTLTCLNTGSYPNSQLQVTIAPGSAAGSTKVTLALSGGSVEIFDNIAGATTTTVGPTAFSGGSDGQAFTGVGSLVAATAGSGYTAGTYTLTASGGGGTGVIASATVASTGVVSSVAISYPGTGYTSAPTFTLSGAGSGTGATFTASLQTAATSLLGTDSTVASPTGRSGMYALRNTGCSVAWLADVTTASTWPNQAQFGLSEGVYMIGTGVNNELITAAQTNKTTNGIDSYAFKQLLGDWVYWVDTYNNGVVRLVSPQPFVGGLIAAYGPQYSSLNQQLNSIVGTQKSQTGIKYSQAELQALAQSGIDVIATPSVGGNYFSARFGRNSSSNAAIHGDNYTRMTNFIAGTINSAAGKFVGQLNTITTRGQAQAFLESFFDTMLQATPQPMIAAYSVQLDGSNNTAQSIAQGYMNAYIKVRYQSVVEYFNIYMEGGQSVVTRQQTTPLV